MKSSTNIETSQRKLLADLANGTLERFKADWPQYAKAPRLARMREELQSIWRRHEAIGWNAPELKQEQDMDTEGDAFANEQADAERDEEERDEHFEEVIIEGWLRRAKNPYQVEWHPKPRLKPNTHSLEAMLALALIRNADSLGYCGRPGCKHPYFFKVRKDQRYCPGPCSAWAKREAKFKWHREHRWKRMWESKTRRVKP